ncbi:MAG: YggS family pyridoxal phosphate-dependent enzyme [Pseudomonadota bacterium]
MAGPDAKLEVIQTASEAAQRLKAINLAISEACAEAGHPERKVHITAVSKKHSAATIRLSLEAGLRLFGENRVQEAMEKWPALREEFPHTELRLIGPLQSNKAADAVAFFDVIETLDRAKLARVLADEIAAQGRAPRLYIQINTGEEPQKSGIAPGDVDAFTAQCRDEYGLPIAGFMCIPPMGEPPAPHFALLGKLAARNGIPDLSMGMSGDFLIAAQLGATHVRIGSGIFGPRPS